MLETLNFVHGSAMRSLRLVMSECSISGRGQGHVSNFYIVYLENFATASRRYTDDIHNSVRSRFVYDTYRTVTATRTRHGWVHMFITHYPTVTLQLHNFDLFRTFRTSSFCTVAWQLARFQLTRRIARSLGDSWASCLHSPSTASGARYRRSACIDMDVLRLAAAACCGMSWISAQRGVVCDRTVSKKTGIVY